MSPERRWTPFIKIHRVALGAIFLTALNCWLIQEWFAVEWVVYADSIEGAFIGISRYWLEHPTATGWFPLWYGGIPFQNAYPPLLQFVTAVTAGAGHVTGGWSVAQSYHFVTGLFYAAGPAALFIVLNQLSGRAVPSFLGALAFTFVCPDLFLLASLRPDIESVWGQRRFQCLASGSLRKGRRAFG